MTSRYTRRTFLTVSGLGLLGAAFGIACGDDDDEDDGSTAEPTTTSGDGDMTVLPLISGWYKDRAVRYYDFGDKTKLTQGSSIAVAPIYLMVHGTNADGSPDAVEGQHNIIAVVPGDPGYSDLWQVMMVTVPEDYEADSIKSASEIMSQGLPVTETDIFVNCPIVEAGAELEGGEAVVQGWHEGEEVFYPDFGMNAPVAIPIWAFITGTDASGAPQFVEGQNNVIDSVPEDAGYSAFWRVNMVMVPDDYEANSIKSADMVRSSGFEVTQTDIVVNCPVVEVA